MSVNPFKPTAGKMPPILVGRQPVIDDFVEGMENGAGAPGRLMLITGQRGYGKTVLLTEFRRIASSRGWVTIAETASDGLVDRIIEALGERGPSVGGASISQAVGIAGVANVSLGKVDISAATAPLTLRNAIEERLAHRKIAKGKGILVTIDEAQAASRDDLVAIATAVQHVIASQDQLDVSDEDKKGIALVFAGLPSVADDLLNDGVITFLRRAMRRHLGTVPVADVRNAYIEAVRVSGKKIGEKTAQKAAELTDGYPYMVQLIGYYMWQSAQRDGRIMIVDEDVTRAGKDAVAAFGNAVCAPALNSVPQPAREMVRLIAQAGPGPASMSDLEASSGKSRSWLNKYRAVLCAAKIVESPARGKVELAIPHMAEYLNEK